MAVVGITYYFSMRFSMSFFDKASVVHFDKASVVLAVLLSNSILIGNFISFGMVVLLSNYVLVENFISFGMVVEVLTAELRL